MKNIKISYQPDILIFFTIIPFISAFNYYLTYSNIKWSWFLIFTFSIDTLQGYLAWWVVRKIILHLDTKISYYPHFFKRMAWQILLTFPAGLGVIAITTEIISWIVRGKAANTNFYTIDLFIISIWFWVINGIYVGIYFYNQWKNTNQSNPQNNPETDSNKSFVVKLGNQTLLIEAEDVLLFFVENEYVRMIDKNLKKYILDLSLEKIEKKISPSNFFRLNRQCIVHRNLIAGFKRLENGKLLAQLQIPLDVEIELTVSRTKAPQFRAWFLPQ